MILNNKNSQFVHPQTGQLITRQPYSGDMCVSNATGKEVFDEEDIVNTNNIHWNRLGIENSASPKARAMGVVIDRRNVRGRRAELYRQRQRIDYFDFEEA